MNPLRRCWHSHWNTSLTRSATRVTTISALPYKPAHRCIIDSASRRELAAFAALEAAQASAEATADCLTIYFRTLLQAGG